PNDRKRFTAERTARPVGRIQNSRFKIPDQKSLRAAQISWHGRPARAHGQDGRATLSCGSAAL
ncbi:MAG: hypothetical protein ABSH52_26955, partial [Terriglobia bacterium]